MGRTKDRSRQEERSARIEHFFGDMVDTGRVLKSLEPRHTSRKEVKDTCRELLEELGYRNAETMSRGANEYSIKYR